MIFISGVLRCALELLFFVCAPVLFAHVACSNFRLAFPLPSSSSPSFIMYLPGFRTNTGEEGVGEGGSQMYLKHLQLKPRAEVFHISVVVVCV